MSETSQEDNVERDFEEPLRCVDSGEYEEIQAKKSPQERRFFVPEEAVDEKIKKLEAKRKKNHYGNKSTQYKC